MESTLKYRLTVDTASGKAELRGFGEEMKKTGKTSEDASKRGKTAADTFGSSLSTLKTMAMGLGITFGALGAVQLFKGLINSSIEFESAFAGVRKTVNATEAQFAALEVGIRDMAKSIPVSAVELSKIATAAGQLGIKTENILSFTRVMADLGVTTNLASEEAATALARLANITQMPQTEFQRLGSTIVALGNNFATTEREIVEMGLRIAGAGKQIGLTEAEIMGVAAALSSVGIEAEAGGSAISKVMIKLANATMTGGEELAQFAKIAGMTGQQFKTAFQQNATQALIAFISGLDRTAKSGGNVFAVLDTLGLQETRVRDALLRAAGAGDLLSKSIDLGSKAWRENTALTKEAEQRYKTTASALQTFWNQLKDTAITFGSKLTPAIVGTTNALKPLNQAFAEDGLINRYTVALTAAILVMNASKVAAFGSAVVSVGKEVVAAGQIMKMAFASGEIKAGLQAITAGLSGMLPVLAAVAAAWAAIKWYDVIKSVNELNESQRTLAQTQRDHGTTVEEMAKRLAAAGITIDRGKDAMQQFTTEVRIAQAPMGIMQQEVTKANPKWQEWADKVKTAFHELAKGSVPTKESTELQKQLTDATTSLTEEQQKLADKLAKIKLEWENSHKAAADIPGDYLAISEGIQGIIDKAEEARIYTEWVKTASQVTQDLAKAEEDKLWPAMEKTSDTLKKLAVEYPEGTWALNNYSKATKDNAKEAETWGDVWAKQISTIQTDLAKGLAESIVHWKGFWGTLKSIAQEAATGILRMVIEPFMGGMLKGVQGMLSGKGTGEFNFGGIGDMFKGLTGLFGGGGQKSPTDLFQGVATSATSAASGVTLLGMSLSTAIPVFGAIAAAGIMLIKSWSKLPEWAQTLTKILLPVTGLISWAIKTPGEKLSADIERDFGGLKIAARAVEEFAESLGLSAKQLEKVRKDFTSSPIFLQWAYDAAKAQGKTEDFLHSLETIETAWGTFNFRKEFEEGLSTKNWDALNQAWAKAFGVSKALTDILPDLSVLFAGNAEESKEMMESVLELTEALLDLRGKPTAVADDLKVLQAAGATNAEIIELLGTDIKWLADAVESGLVPAMPPLIQAFLDTLTPAERLALGLQEDAKQIRGVVKALDELRAKPLEVAKDLDALRVAGASNAEIIELMGGDIKNVVDLFNNGLIPALPPAIQAFWDLLTPEEKVALGFEHIATGAEKAAASLAALRGRPAEITQEFNDLRTAGATNAEILNLMGGSIKELISMVEQGLLPAMPPLIQAFLDSLDAETLAAFGLSEYGKAGIAALASAKALTAQQEAEAEAAAKAAAAQEELNRALNAGRAEAADLLTGSKNLADSIQGYAEGLLASLPVEQAQKLLWDTKGQQIMDHIRLYTELGLPIDDRIRQMYDEAAAQGWVTQTWGEYVAAVKAGEPVIAASVLSWQTLTTESGNLGKELQALGAYLLQTKSTLDAQNIGWQMFGDAIIEAANNAKIYGLALDPIVQASIEWALAEGLITKGADGLYHAVDEVSASVRGLMETMAGATIDLDNFKTPIDELNDSAANLVGTIYATDKQLQGMNMTVDERQQWMWEQFGDQILEMAEKFEALGIPLNADLQNMLAWAKAHGYATSQVNETTSAVNDLTDAVRKEVDWMKNAVDSIRGYENAWADYQRGQEALSVARTPWATGMPLIDPATYGGPFNNPAETYANPAALDIAGVIAEQIGIPFQEAMRMLASVIGTLDYKGRSDAYQIAAMAAELLRAGEETSYARAIETITDALDSGVPHFATGGDVLSSGLAYVDAGERVIPARKGDAGGGGGGITVQIYGDVYGLDDLDKKISESVTRTVRRGGLSFLGNTNQATRVN